jgi:hypothetical protein
MTMQIDPRFFLLLLIFVSISWGPNAIAQSPQQNTASPQDPKASRASTPPSDQTGPSAQVHCELKITAPTDGSTVSQLDEVGGTISSSAARIGAGMVWVVIHPDRQGYWIQPQATVRDELWKVGIYFGTDRTPPGYRFEVQALVGPNQRLRVGQMLTAGFPQARCSSTVIEVRRD